MNAHTKGVPYNRCFGPTSINSVGRCRYGPFLRCIIRRGGGTFLCRGTAIRRLDDLLCVTLLERDHSKWHPSSTRKMPIQPVPSWHSSTRWWHVPSSWYGHSKIGQSSVWHFSSTQHVPSLSPTTANPTDTNNDDLNINNTRS